MPDHTPTPYFPANLEDYAPWVATHGLRAPYGKCQCGCGQDAPVAPSKSQRRGHSKGRPMRFLPNHQTRKRDRIAPANPTGLCFCGCGEMTPLATQTRPYRGLIEGQHVRYIRGHENMPTASVEELFWRNVKKTDSCWLWIAGTSGVGYGMMRYRNRGLSAHRISWEIHNGPIPDGMEVCHNCPGGDNKMCVRPDHLFLGTHADNMQDYRNKKGSA